MNIHMPSGKHGSASLKCSCSLKGAIAKNVRHQQILRNEWSGGENLAAANMFTGLGKSHFLPSCIIYFSQ